MTQKQIKELAEKVARENHNDYGLIPRNRDRIYEALLQVRNAEREEYNAKLQTFIDENRTATRPAAKAVCGKCGANPCCCELMNRLPKWAGGKGLTSQLT